MIWARRLLAISGITYVFTGLTFFFLPEYTAESFPWTITPFVAMTIGGWTLGIGMMGLEALRRFDPTRGYPSMIALWAFSALQLVVTFGVSGARTDHWLTYPYVFAMVAGLGSGLAGVPGLWKLRSELMSKGDGVPRWIRALYVAFVVVTGLLAFVTMFVLPTDGAVFPEPLGVFTTRAFAAFFAALALGAFPLMFTRDPEPCAQYARAGLYPIALILAAAVSFLVVFDFGARPGGLIYIGAYVVTGIAAISIVVWHRRELEAFEPTPRY